MLCVRRAAGDALPGGSPRGLGIQTSERLAVRTGSSVEVTTAAEASGDGKQGSARAQSSALRWLTGLFFLYAFLVGVRALGGGFELLGADTVQRFFAATSNPFVGLSIGILATALVQSSSVTTSMSVALVAAPEDPLPIANAVPMIMGANIGTTVTAKLVSLGHIGNRIEFRRAFAASGCHDCFNLLTVALLLPLELTAGYLERLSALVAGIVPRHTGGELPNPIKAASNFVLEPVEQTVLALSPTQAIGAAVMIIIAAGLLLGSLVGLVKTLRALAAGRLEAYVARALDEKPLTGMAVGGVATAMVQSSSITTSLLVPFASSGIIKLEQAFPIALGANVGTTVTALIASMAAPAQTFHLAVQISLVHLFFNVTGILLIYPLRPVRQVPLRMARTMADFAVRSKLFVIAAIFLVFFGLPGALTLLYYLLH
jgi:sodium-dependent phosphate cotransporter